jgi:hypothetical protein
MLKQQTGDGRTHLAEAEEGEVLLSGHANSWGGAFYFFSMSAAAKREQAAG